MYLQTSFVYLTSNTGFKDQMLAFAQLEVELLTFCHPIFDNLTQGKIYTTTSPNQTTYILKAKLNK